VGRSTPERILDAAVASFAGPGYDGTSLDAIAGSLEVTKQTILYWFPTKEALLEAAIDRSASELASALESALAGAGGGWERIEAVVRSVFRLAARRPELLGLVREASRLGPPAATQMAASLQPLVERASSFLEAEMDAGHMRRHDPHLLLLAIYSTVIGIVTEVEVLRALGEEPTARSLVRRRSDVLDLLRSALVPGAGARADAGLRARQGQGSGDRAKGSSAVGRAKGQLGGSGRLRGGAFGV